MSEIIQLSATDLAAMLCSRVCHDLINPIGAIGNGLEVLGDPTQAAMQEGAQELIVSATKQARAKRAPKVHSSLKKTESATPATPPAPIKTPCVKVCVIGPDGLCRGCARTLDEIVDWARGPMAHLSGECLKDPRLTIAVGDVGDLIRSGRESYDAILLDVDNGPEGLSRGGNDRLYNDSGLAAARRALRPGLQPQND